MRSPHRGHAHCRTRGFRERRPPMRAKVLYEHGEERVFALVFETGDDVVRRLEEFARENAIATAHFTAIGAFSEVTLGYFDWEGKTYLRNPVKEQVEVLSLLGDIALQGTDPKVHAHAVLGRRDSSTCGGHLLEARVRPTLELVLTEPPSYLKREYDP
jgi:predicted DNA-binding protein with PD1-like motif